MTPGELTEILRDGVARRNVPGAALGLWRQGDIDVVTAGFAELGTARPVTPHTIFRLGSISKIYTAMIALRAAMAMLDRPIVEYLADFPLADRAARDGTTLRHLLSHRAGFFGDVFDDLGADADCLSRYWRRAAQLEQVTPPGAAFSYNNAAFVLTAHLSERLLGAGWDELFAQHIVAPFGLARTGTSRATLPGSDVAVSYIADALGRHHPTIELSAGRTMAPAGSAPWSDVPDLLRFGATLIPGNAGDAIPADILARMLAEAAICPQPSFAAGWGLGVQRFDPGGTVVGHDGAVAGQQSFLRVMPKLGIVVALMTNGGDGRALACDVLAHLARAIHPALAPLQPSWPAPVTGFDPSPFVGRYAAADHAVEIAAAGDGLTATFRHGAHADPVVAPLRPDPADPALFVARFRGATISSHQRFTLHGGDATHLLFRGRLFPRKATS